jgi:hypothetical protein
LAYRGSAASATGAIVGVVAAAQGEGAEAGDGDDGFGDGLAADDLAAALPAACSTDESRPSASIRARSCSTD